MPSPSGTYNDGSLQFGSQTATIGAATYVFEKIDVKQNERRIVQNNQYGVPVQKAHVRTLIEGTATLQFPTSSTRSPAQFAVFSLIPAGSATPFNFIVGEVGEAWDHEGETKATITFSEQLSPPQTYT
jgi:hypothetical protein